MAPLSLSERSRNDHASGKGAAWLSMSHVGGSLSFYDPLSYPYITPLSYIYKYDIVFAMTLRQSHVSYVVSSSSAVSGSRLRVLSL